MMKNHGLRRIFSLFLAVFMVCALLPTAALAEDAAGTDETQPKAVVVDEGEKKTDPPAQEQPKDEDPSAPEGPKTFTVTYTDGADGAVFDKQVYSSLSSGTATPDFKGTPEREGYTFAGWKPAVAETVTADVTYAAQWEAGKTSTRALTLPPISGPDVTPAALNTGHKIDVTFTVLYVGDEFNIGYNYGSSEKTKFVCQYKTNHSDTAYNNHTIAISDIKAAASRASVNSGYQIVGWSKESNANPKTWSLNMSGTTACNKGTTIYLVAKNPNPTPTKPDKPSETAVKDLLKGNVVKVHCGNTAASHSNQAILYPLLDGTFSVGDVQGTPGNYTCVVTVHADQYVAEYNKTVPGHTLSPADTTPKTITLKHDGTKWTVHSTTPIVFNVVCNTVPNAPTKQDVVNTGIKVKINCTSNTDHSSDYPLLDNSITSIGTPVKGSTGIYSCDVTVSSGSYVADFNTVWNAVHTPASEDKRVTLFYDNQARRWNAPSNASGVMPIVFNVACVTEPYTPSNDEVKELLGNAAVEIICTNEQVKHGVKSYGLIDGTFEIQGSGYNYAVGIKSIDAYVAKFNTEVGVAQGTHISDNSRTDALFIHLKWDGKSWKVAGDPAKHYVMCKTETVLEAPDHDKLSELIGDITVNCTNSAATHTPKSKGYALMADTYTPSSVEGDAENGYTFTVTVNAEKYVTQFDTDTGAAHTPKDSSKVVTLKYENGAWTVKEGTPVSFNVACVTELYTPGDDEVKELLGDDAVAINCTNGQVDHGVKSYGLIDGTFTVRRDGRNCEVVISSFDQYVAKFNTDVGVAPGTHTSDVSRTGQSIINLKWVDGEWKVVDAPAKHYVVCVTAPDAPKPTDLGDVAVKVTCTTTLAHGTETYPLTQGDFSIGTVTGNAKDGYTCTITAKAEKYITLYENNKGAHTYDGSESKSVTLNWNADTKKWDVPEGTAITFEVKCKLYTVTYTDGVKNKVIFKDDVHENLAYGTATPKFTGGTPKRTGYTFTGWKPTVADKVTGTVVYEAQWKSNSGKDNVPKTGDSEIVMVLGSVLLFSFCGAAAVCVYDRKRKQS